MVWAKAVGIWLSLNYGIYAVNVNSTRVAISDNSRGMFWEVVARFLKNAPEIEVFTFGNEQELESLLRNDDAIVHLVQQGGLKYTICFSQFTFGDVSSVDIYITLFHYGNEIVCKYTVLNGYIHTLPCVTVVYIGNIARPLVGK